MAGSSLPVAWRSPWLEHEKGVELDEALAVGFSGLDIYGFHTLEALQCMVERRRGGESGVAAVTCFEGDAVWQAAERGVCGRASWPRPPARRFPTSRRGSMEEHCPDPALFSVEYRDGLRGSALMLNGYVTDLAYAGPASGTAASQPPSSTARATAATGVHAHFSYLGLNIEEMFVSGRPNLAGGSAPC